MADVAEEVVEAVEEVVEEIEEELEEEEEFVAAAGATEVKLFGKWSFDDIEVRDISLEVSFAGRIDGVIVSIFQRCGTRKLSLVE